MQLTPLNELLPPAWRHPILEKTLEQQNFKDFTKILHQLEQSNKLRPHYNEIFYALQLTKPSDVKVVILGQDPYPRPGDAMGLSFSIKPDQKQIPKSLQNIQKELKTDCNIDNTTASGDLTKWAKQGVLLLNTTLTTKAHQSNAHEHSPWSYFTTLIIQYLDTLASETHPIVFILWGNNARSKKELLRNPYSYILESTHPSPFSAHKGFYGSRPFSKTNQILTKHNQTPINWKL